MISSTFKMHIIPGVLVFASVVCAQATQGIPGVDYPNYHSIPKTSFSCSDQVYIPGFYADLETQCQVFHFCFKDRQESFLCPTGTIFNQATLACDSWDASNCSLASLLYNVNGGPVLESAVRKLPMMLKLKNRSQGKSKPTSPNIFEKISSLYEAGSDSTGSAEEVETSNLSGDISEVFSSNVSEDKSSDSSPEYPEGAETDRLLEGLSEVEQNLQQDAVAAGDGKYEDSASMNVELDEGTDIDSLYDPVTGGYYMDYNPYQWQDSEPVSDEFRNFYDYENRQDEYEALYQDHGDSGENEVQAEPVTEDFDSNVFSHDETDAEFSKRQFETRKPKKRPMYWVVEDEDEQDSSLPTDSVLGDEPSLASFTDQADSDANEASTEVPSESDETLESGEGPQVSEEELRRLMFPMQGPTLPTRRPLTADQFSELLQAEFMGDEPQTYRVVAPLEQSTYEESEDEMTSFQGDDQSVNLQDINSDGDYELDSSAYDFDSEREESLFSDDSVYEDSEADGDQNELDDTLLIIPEESDADALYPSSEDTDAGEVEDEYVAEGYAYVDGSNEQMDAESLSDEGYDEDEYEDGYEYYKSRRDYPEAYEDIDPSYESPEYGYAGIYGRQYIPEQMYGAGEYDQNVDYSNYSPEEAARLAYLSSLYNRDPYSYMRQRYQQSGYMDPVYGTENGYFRDDPYAAVHETSDYYASDETGDYYSEADDPWVQKDSEYEPREYELENQLDLTDSPLPLDITEADLVTDSPLPLDVTEADLEDPEEALNVVEPEDFDFTPEDQTFDQKDTYYVFDFDEDNEGKGNAEADFDLKLDDALLEPDVNESLEDDYSEQLNLQEILGSENLQTDVGSVSNDNITVYKDDNLLPESIESEPNGEQSLDELLTSQTDNEEMDQREGESALNTKSVSGNWSPLMAESSQADKPVTLSSAFERLNSPYTGEVSQSSGVSMGFPTETRFSNNMVFSESMDFGPYGYGAGMGQFNMLNSMQPNNHVDSFSHRSNENEQDKVPRLSSIQERLRSMKQGKFGVFKKYMSSMRGRNV